MPPRRHDQDRFPSTRYRKGLAAPRVPGLAHRDRPTRNPRSMLWRFDPWPLRQRYKVNLRLSLSSTRAVRLSQKRNLFPGNREKAGSRAVDGFGVRQRRHARRCRLGSVAGSPRKIRIVAGYKEVSRPGELHPESLAEPNVSLSTHSAPVIQPILRRHASGQTTRGGRSSPCVAILHYVACAAAAACTFSEPTA